MSTSDPGSLAAYAAQCDQEAGVLSAPRDHTGDALFAAYKSAETLHQFARDSVAEAEKGLELLKLAEQRAGENAQSAADALRAHNAGLFDTAQWLVKRRS